MIDFTVTWCSWCVKMDEETYSDSRVIAKSQEFVCVRIDGDARGDLVVRYNIDGFPTIVFLKSNGSEIRRCVGYKNADNFLIDMDQALKNK